MKLFLLSLLPMKNLFIGVPLKQLVPIIFLLSIYSELHKRTFYRYSRQDLRILVLSLLLLIQLFPLSTYQDSWNIFLSFASFFTMFLALRLKIEKLSQKFPLIIVTYFIFEFLIRFIQYLKISVPIFTDETLVMVEGWQRISGGGYVNDNSLIAGLIVIYAIQTRKAACLIMGSILFSTSLTGAAAISVFSALILWAVVRIRYYGFVKSYLLAFSLTIAILFLYSTISVFGTGVMFIDERFSSLSIRLTFWAYSINQFMQEISIYKLLFGGGAGFSRELMSGMQYGTTHSNILGLFFDIGIIGLMTWYALIFRLCKGNVMVIAFISVTAITHEFYFVASNLIFILVSSNFNHRKVINESCR